jgi:hypothetical protein
LNQRKKIRIRQILKVVKENKCSLKEIAQDAECDNNNNCDITEFYSVLGTNYLETCIVDEATTLYVCGYASNSVYKKIDCTFCQCSIREAKGDEVGCPYFDSLQRGGLSLPTEFVITIFFHMNAIFLTINNDAVLNSLFLMKTKQTKILRQLTNVSLENNNFFGLFNIDCVCGKSTKSLAELFYPIFSNILLNNYTKIRNDFSRSKEVQSKGIKRKIKTYK